MQVCRLINLYLAMYTALHYFGTTHKHIYVIQKRPKQKICESFSGHLHERKRRQLLRSFPYIVCFYVNSGYVSHRIAIPNIPQIYSI